MSYNFDNDYTKYLKFRKKKLRKLFRVRGGWVHRPHMFTTRKRKHMLFGIFNAMVSHNLVSYNKEYFHWGGVYDYDYDDEGWYNIHYIYDMREIGLPPQSTLLVDIIAYATNYIFSNVHDDIFSYNFFYFIDVENDWAAPLNSNQPVAKYRFDNMFAFDLFGTTVEKWYHFANPVLGSYPSLKGDLWKYTHIYRGRPPYTLNDRVEWLNEKHRYLHRFFKYGDSRNNFFSDHFFDRYFLRTLFNLPPLDDKLKYKNMEEMINGSHFITGPLVHYWQRSFDSFFINKKKDFNTGIPNLEEDIKEIKEFKNLNVYFPEFKNLRRLKLYQQNLSARKDYKKYKKQRRRRKKTKLRHKLRYEMKMKAFNYVRGPFWNYWFRRMGYMAFISTFIGLLGITALVTLNARPRSYKHMKRLKLRAFRRPFRYSKYMNFSVARQFYFLEDKLLLKKKIYAPYFSTKNTLIFLSLFILLCCVVL